VGEEHFSYLCVLASSLLCCWLKVARIVRWVEVRFVGIEGKMMVDGTGDQEDHQPDHHISLAFI